MRKIMGATDRLAPIEAQTRAAPGAAYSFPAE